MFGKIASFGAVLALTLSVGAVTAQPLKSTFCRVTKTRCCDKVQYCCDQPEKATCCKTGTACCDKEDCCGPKKATAASVCTVTGRSRAQSCASKASPQPPFSQQDGDTDEQFLEEAIQAVLAGKEPPKGAG